MITSQCLQGYGKLGDRENRILAGHCPMLLNDFLIGLCRFFLLLMYVVCALNALHG